MRNSERFIENNNEIYEIENENKEVSDAAQESFKGAATAIMDVLDTAKHITEDKEAIIEEKQEQKDLLKKGSDAFTNFYKRLKKIAAPLSLSVFLFSQDKPASEAIAKASQNIKPLKEHSLYLVRDDMPLKVKILDYLMRGDVLNGFLDVYNTFAELKEKRVNGKMTDEEIAFKEKIAENIRPYAYGVNF